MYIHDALCTCISVHIAQITTPSFSPLPCCRKTELLEGIIPPPFLKSPDIEQDILKVRVRTFSHVKLSLPSPTLLLSPPPPPPPPHTHTPLPFPPSQALSLVTQLTESKAQEQFIELIRKSDTFGLTMYTITVSTVTPSFSCIAYCTNCRHLWPKTHCLHNMYVLTHEYTCRITSCCLVGLNVYQ